MTRPKIVLLGMLTKIPVGGVLWLVGHYAVGFRRLGYDVYYVEAHARTPSMFMDTECDDGAGKAAAYLARELARFEVTGWAYHALHDDGRCHGMTVEELRCLYREAALIVNLHGGTEPLEEHAASGRLIYMGTDPVDVELELDRADPKTEAYLEPHAAFFTWGLNHGNPDCTLPWSTKFPFTPTPPPVVMDLWHRASADDGHYTTIGNWRQPYRDIWFRGERLTWSKHDQFAGILGLPARVASRFRLALSSYDPTDEQLLRSHGWGVTPALPMSADPDAYQRFIEGSRGEFSVAKQQNVHFRSGWFSERSATYLAAGRPVILQDTGFGNYLPTGMGLMPFSDLDSAAAAIEAVESDYECHRRAAEDLARAYLSHEVVLGHVLAHLGMSVATTRPRPVMPPRPAVGLPRDIELEPLARRPLRLPVQTVDAVLRRPVPMTTDPLAAPDVSVIVVAYGSLALTRMTLESVLANTEDTPYELIVIDNAAGAATGQYLSVLAARNRNVRVRHNAENVGFAAGCNQGVAMARGAAVILLNNDTIVTPGWEAELLACLADHSVGLAVPATNRCGNAAEIPTRYGTYGELLSFAFGRRLAGSRHEPQELDVAIMFCVALRRELVDEVGRLDERFGIGTFEDDDFSIRVRCNGYRIVCVGGSFVHHFGEGSLGDLAPSGDYAALLARNQGLFEAKWHTPWRRNGRSADSAYQEVITRTRVAVAEHLPTGASVLVVSKGDDALIDLPGVHGRHFPCTEDGTYAGYYPNDGRQAVEWLEAGHGRGATHFLVPAPSLWWLEHYDALRRHLDRHYDRLLVDDDVVIYSMNGVGQEWGPPGGSS